MCGIIGYIGKGDAVPLIVDGLKRLEYRGYDSAGIAFFTNGRIGILRSAGKIKDLERIIQKTNIKSTVGIGHTRWATHGRPSEENAHPHRSGKTVIVHNGIIENYLSLKERLTAEGHIFKSETDSEVICHLIESFIRKGMDLEKAVRAAIKEMHGAFAIGIIHEKNPDKIIAVRKDSPLVVGLGNNEFFMASDIPAFLSHTRDVIFLDDFEMAILSTDGLRITDFEGGPVEKNVVKISWNPAMAEKGGYRHFMLKEIYEQPRAITDTMRGRFSLENGEINLDEFSMDKDTLRTINRVLFVACGTSWHACLIGKYLVEMLARVPAEAEIASEFRYRDPIINDTDLFVSITQSGETADTLAAQREARKLGAKILNICNVVGSTSAREAEVSGGGVFYTHSGPEIGVASTKAFTSQLTALYLLAIALGRTHKMLDKETTKTLLTDLIEIPSKVENILSMDSQIEALARELFHANNFLYLGRGINYPIALEGALKLKEISYIHAEGYPAGEMKHGPIALIDRDMPSVFFVPKDRTYDKILSNIEEVKSRGGRVVAIATESDTMIKSIANYTLYIPETNMYLTPLLFAIYLQLIAYHIAVLRGCDVDQPRNLAKSVTVE
ncbi:MAG: glutamine--fructose-6-phosphate transaminase (isomerizing) [Nitrospira sp.]|nr:glutamine--fructose-6-phosphate transaminase (isomerizing) [Nitrospira sp.]